METDSSAIDPERIGAVEQFKLAGLQVADPVASSLLLALKMNRYGETELSYLPHLKKTICRHKSVVLDWGLKWSPKDYSNVKVKAPEAVNLEGL